MSHEEIKVAFLLADYGHDPTETAIPFHTFKNAGFTISILTETGHVPACDERMLSGWTGKLLGADAAAVRAYHAMTATPEWQHPRSWTNAADVPSLLPEFHLVFLPGGHDRGVRQLLDSPRAHALLAEFFPATRRPSPRVCAAICHGVQALAHAKLPAAGGGGGSSSSSSSSEEGISVLHDATTTALPAVFETAAFQGTRLMLGDYYKTYGAGTANVEEVVKGCLADPKTQWRSSPNPGAAMVVADDGYNYLSGRWPGDAQLLADRTVELVKKAQAGSA